MARRKRLRVPGQRSRTGGFRGLAGAEGVSRRVAGGHRAAPGRAAAGDRRRVGHIPRACQGLPPRRRGPTARLGGGRLRRAGIARPAQRSRRVLPDV